MQKSMLIEQGIWALRRAYDIQRELYLRDEIHRKVDMEEHSRGKRLFKGSYIVEKTLIDYFKRNQIRTFLATREYGNVQPMQRGELMIALNGLNDPAFYASNRADENRCAENQKKSFGATLAISRKLRPRYSEFDFAGFVDFVNERIVYGVPRLGVFEIYKPGKEVESERRLLTPKEEMDQQNEIMGKLKRHKIVSEIKKDIDIKLKAERSYLPYSFNLSCLKSWCLYVPHFADEKIDKAIAGKLQPYSEDKTKTLESSFNHLMYSLLTRAVNGLEVILSENVRSLPVLFTLNRELGGFGLYTGEESSNIENNWLGFRPWSVMHVRNGNPIETNAIFLPSSELLSRKHKQRNHPRRVRTQRSN